MDQTVEYKEGDRVKYKPIGGATSKVSDTTGKIIAHVKGTGADAVYTIENDNTHKKTDYHVGNIEGTLRQ